MKTHVINGEPCQHPIMAEAVLTHYRLMGGPCTVAESNDAWKAAMVNNRPTTVREARARLVLLGRLK